MKGSGGGQSWMTVVEDSHEGQSWGRDVGDAGDCRGGVIGGGGGG